MHVTAAQDGAGGLPGAAHLPEDGVRDPPLPPLGEAALPCSSPLTEGGSWPLAGAGGGLVERVVWLGLSSPEVTTRCGEA